MSMKTADICDTYGDLVQYVDGGLLYHYGGWMEFAGKIRTVKCFEDSSKIEQMLAQDGNGQVLVVDGGASTKRALLGDLLCRSAIPKGWAGIIINGCVRDAQALSMLDIGIMAIGSTPRKTDSKKDGEIDVEVTFGGVTFKPGSYLYADGDGVVISDTALVQEAPGSPRDIPKGPVNTEEPGPFSPSWGDCENTDTPPAPRAKL